MVSVVGRSVMVFVDRVVVVVAGVGTMVVVVAVVAEVRMRRATPGNKCISLVSCGQISFYS